MDSFGNEIDELVDLRKLVAELSLESAPESNSKKEIIPNLIMVPLVAYDNHLNRIGYGGGYYDRILEKVNKVNKRIIFLGIAYSFQKCSSIPVNKHDFKLDYIFTERGIISSN